MIYRDFINAAQQKFPNKFEYLEDTFVNMKTHMTINEYEKLIELTGDENGQ